MHTSICIRVDDVVCRRSRRRWLTNADAARKWYARNSATVENKNCVQLRRISQDDLMITACCCRTAIKRARPSARMHMHERRV